MSWHCGAAATMSGQYVNTRLLTPRSMPTRANVYEEGCLRGVLHSVAKLSDRPINQEPRFQRIAGFFHFRQSRQEFTRAHARMGRALLRFISPARAKAVFRLVPLYGAGFQPAFRMQAGSPHHKSRYTNLTTAPSHFPRSKRSRFITFSHVATKSCTNFFCASPLAYTSAKARNWAFEPKTRSTRVAVH